MSVPAPKIEQLSRPVIQLSQNYRKFLERLPSVRDRLGDCFVVIDCIVIESREESLGRQVCRIAKSTQSTCHQRILVIRRDSEPAKTVRTIGVVVPNRKVSCLEDSDDLSIVRVANRAPPV